jgi:hypothetical protein
VFHICGGGLPIKDLVDQVRESEGKQGNVKEKRKRSKLNMTLISETAPFYHRHLGLVPLLGCVTAGDGCSATWP